MVLHGHSVTLCCHQHHDLASLHHGLASDKWGPSGTNCLKLSPLSPGFQKLQLRFTLPVPTVLSSYKFLCCLQNLLPAANEPWGKKQHFLYVQLGLMPPWVPNSNLSPPCLLMQVFSRQTHDASYRGLKCLSPRDKKGIL